MSGRTLQFLRYRKEKVDLRSLFIAVSFRSVSDSDMTRKSESMTVGVMAGLSFTSFNAGSVTQKHWINFKPFFCELTNYNRNILRMQEMPFYTAQFFNI